MSLDNILLLDNTNVSKLLKELILEEIFEIILFSKFKIFNVDNVKFSGKTVNILYDKLRISNLYNLFISSGNELI